MLNSPKVVVQQDPNSTSNKRALRKEVGREIARHKAMTEECSRIFRALNEVHSDESLRTLSSLPIQLGKSSQGLQQALNNWSKCLVEKAARASETREKKDLNGLTRREATVLRAQLAECRKLLAERVEQMNDLLKEGLRLALKKEELEKQLQASSTWRPSLPGDVNKKRCDLAE